MTRQLVAGLGVLVLVALAALGNDVPRPAPEYAIKLTTGKQILLSSLRGNVVALLFVSTECPHCGATCQLVDKLQKEYGPRGFQPVAVAFNEMSMMLVPDFTKRRGISFPVGYDTRDPVFTFIERSPMLRTYVPILVLIDRSGTIRGQYLGDDKFFLDQEKNIRASLDQLLKEPAGKKAPAAKRSSPPAKKKSS